MQEIIVKVFDAPGNRMSKDTLRTTLRWGGATSRDIDDALTATIDRGYLEDLGEELTCTQCDEATRRMILAADLRLTRPEVVAQVVAHYEAEESAEKE